MDKKMPFTGILRKIIADSKNGITLEDVAKISLQKWGRNLPQTPYLPVALVYKLTGLYMASELEFSDCHIMVERTLPNEIKVPLAPDLPVQDLNSVVEELKKIKVKVKK